MAELFETTYEHLAGQDTFTVTAAERWSISMLRRLQKKYPDSIEIVAENPDGSLLAHVPFDWMRISPKYKLNLTAEQREERSKKLLAAKRSKYSTEIESISQDTDVG